MFSLSLISSQLFRFSYTVKYTQCSLPVLLDDIQRKKGKMLSFGALLIMEFPWASDLGVFILPHRECPYIQAELGKEVQSFKSWPKERKGWISFSFSTLEIWHNFTFLILYIDVFNIISFWKDMKRQLRNLVELSWNQDSEGSKLSDST